MRMLPVLALLAATAQAPIPARLEGSAPAILPDLVHRWTDGFAAERTGVTIAVAPPYGPPQGALSPRLAAFLAGKLDFAFLTRKLSDSDVTAFRARHGHDPLVIPVAGGSWRSFGYVDPVAIIVNARNPVRGLSFPQLRALYSDSGTPPDWDRLGARGWSGRPVHVLGPIPGREDSARGGVFRERVLKGGDWRNRGMIGVAEADVVARVAADPLAIGFIGLGHVAAGTKAVAIGNGQRLVTPSRANVSSGLYPLARTVDLVVDRPPGTCLRPELLRFIRYLLGPKGQEAIRQEGHFLRLSADQRRGTERLASACN